MKLFLKRVGFVILMLCVSILLFAFAGYYNCHYLIEPLGCDSGFWEDVVMVTSWFGAVLIAVCALMPIILVLFTYSIIDDGY